MNRDCHGDFYVYAGKRFYRCLLDSTVIEDQDPKKPCGRCGRAVFGQEHGDVASRTMQEVEVFYDKQWHLHDGPIEVAR